MADANDNMGVGGGAPPPSPLGSPSTEADEKAMRKGKGRMLAVMIVAVVAGLGGIGIYMMSGGEAEAYSNFGKSVNGVDQEHFDQFWGCVLPNYDLGKIKNNEDLSNQIHMRAESRPKDYAKHVRDECLPKLEDMDPELTSLIPPEEMKKPLEGLERAPIPSLVDATDRLRSGWSDYISYLDTTESYDRENDKVDASLSKIARAWYDYKTALGALNSKISDKLGKG